MVLTLWLISSATALCSSVAGGDLRGHVDDIAHGLVDARQRTVGTEHLLDAAVGMDPTGLGGLHGVACLLLQLFDELVDLAGGRTGTLGQLAYLVGNHGEAAAALAGARRLDGGVECQQVGLIGDALITSTTLPIASLSLAN